MSGFAQSTQVAGDEGGEKSLPLNLHPHPPAKGPAHHQSADANPIRRNDLRSLDTDVFASTYVDLYSMPNSIRSFPAGSAFPAFPAFDPHELPAHELHDICGLIPRIPLRAARRPGC